MVTLVALVALLARSSDAAIVYLRDGSRIQGTVLQSSGREVVVDTPDGVLHINTSRIDHVDYGQAPSPEVRRARAERLYPFQTLSFLAGATFPFGTIDLSDAGGGTQRNGDWGPLIGLQYLYHTTPHWAFGLEFDYNHRSVDDSLGALPNAQTDAWGDSLLFLGLLKAPLATSGWIRPHLLAGGGAQRTSIVLDATPAPGFVWGDTMTGETRRLVDDARWGWAATARLGFDFLEGAPYVFGLELGWTRLASRSYAATAAGKALGLSSVSGPVDFFTVAGRWGFSFGGGAP